MAYVKQSFRVGEKLTSAKLNQLSDNIEDHVHGQGLVSEVALADDTDKLDGQNGAYYDDFPNGASCVFYMGAAPVGWALSTAINDRVIRIVNSAAGGKAIGGSWTITGLSASTSNNGAHTHGGTQGHALTLNEIPAHNHGGGNHRHTVDSDGDENALFDSGIPPGGTSVAADSPSTTSIKTGVISTQGGNQAHSHGITSDGGHTHTITISHDGGWRMKWVNAIICTRNK